MVFLVVESRVINIGINNCRQFEPVYLAEMAETIVEGIKDKRFDFKEQIPLKNDETREERKEKIKKGFTMRDKKIKIFDQPIFIRLTEKVYDKIYQKKYAL